MYQSRKLKLHRERYWIEKLSNVVNKERPVITKEEGIIKAKKSIQSKHTYWGDLDKLYRDTPNNLLLIC